MSQVLRSLVLSAAVLTGFTGIAQRLDSVHIFLDSPDLAYSTSLAERTAWSLQRSATAYVRIGSTELSDLNRELEQRRPSKHAHAALPGLSHLGFVYLDKAAHAFCLADEQGLIIDLTARRQYRIEDWADRLKLRTLLLALGL